MQQPNCRLVCAFFLFSAVSIHAQEKASPSQIKFFEKNIRPALVKYCYECHSVEAGDSRAGLLVDTRLGLLQGGDSGPALVPGNADESLIWEAINWDGYEMPPSKKMPADVIAHFKTWIEMGAPDPRVREKITIKSKITKADIKEGQKHWAFQKPTSKKGDDIDSLVDVKLKEDGLAPSEPADAYTLLRRINFDLVGLPPTPSEIQTFRSDFKRDPDNAVRTKIDALLAKPQYGERWGRHWLDVARYAESSGSRNVSYPHAWRYRNYVIDSFNDNTPYDRFIAEQIAGDLLPVKSDEQWQENLIATGFLAIGLKHHDQKNPRKFTADMIDEQIDTTTQAVLGLTVACARCHDHKYDPIPTHDYYALAGIFASTKTFYGTTRIAQNHRPSDLLLLPVPDKQPAGGKAQRQSLDDLKARVAALDRQMQGVRGKERRGLRNNRNRIAAQIASFNPDGTPKSFGMGVQENDRMIDAPVLLGGEVDKPAQEVPRGFVQVLGKLNFTVKGNKSGRRELVDAMTSKNNPLTARVMMNRVWMHLLGKPLVETPSNFGFSGTKPENQALLDHLAVRFMENDWNIQSMIREIMMSDAYRRSSKYNRDNYAVDPDNKLLWRANPRQLDAEVMRDAMLALSGRLDLKRPANSTVAPAAGKPGSRGADPNDPHRSVYLPIVRDKLPEPLDLFDFPDPNITSAGRSESIVPTQALYMMNDDFVTAQASGMAAGLEQQHTNQDDQIRTAFLWAYGRPATNEELQASAEFFREFKPTASSANASNPRPTRQRSGMRGQRGGTRRRGMQNTTPTAPSTNNQALAVFCQTLMASARFRILN